MEDDKAKLLQFLKDWLAWAEAEGATKHDDAFDNVGLCAAWSNYIDACGVTCNLLNEVPWNMAGALAVELRKDFGQSVDPFRWYAEGRREEPYDWEPRVNWVRKKIKELSA